VELSNGTILSPAFIPAVEKLLTIDITVRECISLTEAIENVNVKLGTLEKAKSSLVERFAKKGEDGKVMMEPSSENPNLYYPLFGDEESKVEFSKAIRELLSETYNFPLENKIRISESVRMSTEEFRLIKDIIEVVKD